MESKAAPLRIWIKLNLPPESDAPPSKRSGHSMVLRANQLYVFGGFDGTDCLNDLHSFDLHTRKWRQIEPEGLAPSPPPGRTSHCAVLDCFSLRMYVLFGSGKNFGNANLRDVWSFDFKTSQWERVRTVGQSPPGMYGHSGIFSHNFIYVFGGTTGTAYFNHLYRLCLVTKAWKRMALASQSTEPGARYKHACFLSPRTDYLPSPGLIIFGGKSSDRRYVDAFEFSFSLNKWAISDPHPDSKRLFNARFAHTVSQDETDSESGEAWVFGGSDDKPRDSILRLDLTKSTWTKFAVSLPGDESSTPAARDFHSAALDPSSLTLYIFGGTFNDARLNDLWSIRLKGEEETTVRPRDSLLSELGSLFLHSGHPHAFSDFTIRLPDGSALHTYRAFLRMRLPHFFSTFGDHSSSVGEEVKMEERKEIVRAILEFAYTGRASQSFISFSLDDVIELAYVCFKYRVFPLLSECLRFLGFSLSLTTAGTILNFCKQLLALIKSHSSSSSQVPSYLSGLIKKASTQISSLSKAAVLFAASHYKDFRAQPYTANLSPDFLSQIDELSSLVQAQQAAVKPKRTTSSSSQTSPYLVKSKSSSAKTTSASVSSKLQEFEVQSDVLFQESSERQFRKDLVDLWEERGSTGDFRLILGGAGGKVERVHSCVLAARSEYFANLFGSQMIEQQSGEMVVADPRVEQKPELFRLFLKFLYSDKEALKSVQTFSFEEAVFLLEQADFFALRSPRFKFLVESKCKVKVDKENALELLLAGEDIIAKKLRGMAIRALVEKFEELHLVAGQLAQLSPEVLAEIIALRSKNEAAL